MSVQFNTQFLYAPNINSTASEPSSRTSDRKELKTREGHHSSSSVSVVSSHSQGDGRFREWSYVPEQYLPQSDLYLCFSVPKTHVMFLCSDGNYRMMNQGTITRYLKNAPIENPQGVSAWKNLCDHNVYGFDLLNLSTAICCFARRWITISKKTQPLVLKEHEEIINQIRELINCDMEGLSDSELIDVIWSFTKLKMIDSIFLEAAYIATCKKLDRFKSHGLVTVAWAFAQWEVYPSHLYTKISEVAYDKIDNFTNSQIAKIARCFAMLDIDSHKLFLKIKELLLTRFSKCNTTDTVNIIWAIAKMGYLNGELFAQIRNVVLRHIQHLRPFSVALLATAAFNYAGINDKALVNGIRERVIKIKEFKSNRCAAIALAWVELGKKDPELFKAISVNILSQIQNVPLCDLCKIAWAFAKFGIKNEALFAKINDRICFEKSCMPNCENEMHGLNPELLSKLAWAYAFLDLDLDVRDLFAKISFEAMQKVYDFDSYQLGSIAWSFARLDMNNATLFESIRLAFLDKISECSVVDLRNIATAFAKFDRDDRLLFNKIAEWIANKIDEEEFCALDISSFTWAFATVRIDSELLFKSISTIVAKITRFAPSDIALIVRTFASMRMHDEIIIKKMEQCVFADIARFNAKQIADMIWSFAQFGKVDMLDALFHQLEIRIEEDEDTDLVDYVEIYQVFLCFKEHIHPLKSFVGLNKEIERDLNLRKKNPPDLSALHQDIIKELRHAGIPHRAQMFTRGYFIPIFFNYKIGIEIFEPQNYLVSGKESGEWIFRKEVLKKSGYDLTDIAFKDWGQLSKEQKASLILKLKNALSKKSTTKKLL